MTDKKDQEENLKQFIQKDSIWKGEVSKAPPPITPLSGWGYVPPKTPDPKPLEPQEEIFVQITGTELMKKWSVGWEAIFHFADQEKLIPYKPKRFRTCVDYDRGMLSDYSPEEREKYFSQWQYHPNNVEAFEAQHGNILDEWRKKVVSKEDKETSAAPVETSTVNFLIREGDYWNIGFKGQVKRGIKHLDGFLYIGYLLKKLGESVSCTELYRAVLGMAPDNIMSDGSALDEDLDTRSSKQGISDYKAKEKYLIQWQKLQADIDNAEDTPQGEMVKEESKKEQDEITPYLKERSFADPNDKKAQVNIRKRLKTVYKAIDKAGMEEMAKHLRDHIKPDNAYGLSYSGSVTWEITIK